MEKVITAENFRDFAYVNDNAVKGEIKGVVVFFMGLGGTTTYEYDCVQGEIYGEKGLLYIMPYSNPWAWMNKWEVKLTDDVLDAVFEKFGLKEDTPVASTGGSMGGLGALVYALKAKRTPVIVSANCPVCDAVYHYGERPDLPRTMYSALCDEEGDLLTALKGISPIHLAERMPKIKYRIFHSDADQSVNMDMHSKRFYEKMKGLGHDITLSVYHGRRHCDFDYPSRKEYFTGTVNALLGAKE